MSRGCKNHYGLMREERWPELRELHAQGLSRNAISREMGITGSVVSRTAEHLGLSFDRSRIQPAMDALRADLEERRIVTAMRFQEVAEDSLDRLDEPVTVYSFGGKDNTYEEHTFDEPPIAERQKLVTTAAIATDKSLKLVPPAASGSGADDAKSMLGKLAQGIAELANADDETAAGEE